MIRGIGDATSSTYSQTLNSRGNPVSKACFARASKGNRLKFPNRTRRLTATLGSPRRRRGLGKSYLFSFNTAHPETAHRRWSRAGRAPHVGGVRQPRRALENPEDRVSFAPGRTHNRIVSKVNSLRSMEECRQGKSAKWIRNFGKRIGSRGRARGPSPEPVGWPPSDRSSRSRGESGPPRALLGTDLERSFEGLLCVERRLESVRQGESDRLIKTKHCDGPRVMLTQCDFRQRLLECQSEEIQPSAVNGGVTMTLLRVACRHDPPRFSPLSHRFDPPLHHSHAPSLQNKGSSQGTHEVGMPSKTGCKSPSSGVPRPSPSSFPRMCQGRAKDVPRPCQGCAKVVQGKCGAKDVPRRCQGCAKAVPRMCQGCA
ncbi:hypothetical protein Syun_031886 [Stephania yunnanensis]|uniref:Uncharacterized protein n=1 Tax=Stephania yunnanensis TaxID=152371 RepID=A0AAP0DTL8_9MAGN